MTQGQMLTVELRALPESFASDEHSHTLEREVVVRDRLAFRQHRRVGATWQPLATKQS